MSELAPDMFELAELALLVPAPPPGGVPVERWLLGPVVLARPEVGPLLKVPPPGGDLVVPSHVNNWVAFIRKD